LDNFAFGEIVGRAGIFYNEIVTVGLTLLGPQLYYQWHYHPAIELVITHPPLRGMNFRDSGYG
jgi:hypothetical protein